MLTDMDHLASRHGLAENTISQLHMGGLEQVRTQSFAGGVLKSLSLAGLGKKDDGGGGIQLAEGLRQQNIEHDTLIETSCNGLVDGVQGLELFQPVRPGWPG